MGHIVTESGPKRPGAVLRARREALDVTVREVAETLNLSIAMIEAIEADQMERLPGTVFARGYVRAYARLLELDPQPLLEHYPRNEAAVAPGEVPSEPPIWEWIRRRPGLVLGGVGGALVALLVLVVLTLWPEAGDGMDRPVTSEPSAAGADLASGAGDAAAREQWPAAPGQSRATQDGRLRAALSPSEAAAAAADPQGPAGAAATNPAAAVAAEGAPERGQTALAGAGFDSAATVPAPGSDGPRRITAGGDDRLTFGFSDDCWVEVKSASGASLYSDLNQAGSKLELVGQGPFRILLGYAPGAELDFNGEPVPLAPHTRNNVATLVLGQ